MYNSAPVNLQNNSSQIYNNQFIQTNLPYSSIPNIFQNYTYVGKFANFANPTIAQNSIQGYQPFYPQEMAKQPYYVNPENVQALELNASHQGLQCNAQGVDSEDTTEDCSDLNINKYENKDLSAYNSPVYWFRPRRRRADPNSWQEVQERLEKEFLKKIYKLKGKKMGPTKLRDHYKSLTKGTLPKRVKFTHTEDLNIAKYFDLYGCDWEKVSSHFPNRTPMMIKNRYYSFIRKKSLQEDLLNEANGSSNASTPQKQEVPKETTSLPLQQVQQIAKFPQEDNYFGGLDCKRITSTDISLAFPNFAPEDQLHHRITSNAVYQPEEPNFSLDFISYGNAPYINRGINSSSLEPNYAWNFQL